MHFHVLDCPPTSLVPRLLTVGTPWYWPRARTTSLVPRLLRYPLVLASYPGYLESSDSIYEQYELANVYSSVHVENNSMT